MKKLLITILLLLPNLTFATTYYIDATGGLDTNTGTSEAQAWKTAPKASGLSFSPDDNILFKRGETWNEGFEIRSSGTAGHPITYGAYGTGAKPIITKVASIPDWDLTATWTNLPFTTANKLSWTRYSSIATENVLNGRMIVPANYFSQSADKIRIKAGAHLTLPVSVDSIYIGEQASSGNIYDMKVGTISQFLFLGETATTTLVNTEIYSDWLDYTFDSTKTYIISIGINSMARGIYGYTGEYQEDTYYAFGSTAVANAGTADVSLTHFFNGNWGIASIELDNTSVTDSNVWSVTRSQDPERVWLNGTERGVTEKIARLNSTYSWFHSGGVLYIYSVGNPAETYSNIEVSGLSGYLLYCADKNYANIEGLDLRGGYRSSFFVEGCSNLNITGNNIGWGSGTYGVQVQDSDTNPSNNGTITNNNVDAANHVKNYWHSETSDDGIKFSDNTNDWIVSGNYLDGWAHTAIAFENPTEGLEIRDHKVFNNSITCPDIEYCRAFGGNAFYGDTSGIEIYNNIATSTSIRSQIEMPGIKFYNNIIAGVYNDIDAFAEFPGGFQIYSGTPIPTEVSIYNNIFANTQVSGINVSGNGETDDVTANYFRNNVIYETGTSTDTIVYGTGPALAATGFGLIITDYPDTVYGNTYENNSIYNSGITDTVYYGGSAGNDYPKTISEFNAQNGTLNDVITGNISSDPLFTSPSSFNFTTQPLSPLIDSGTSTGRTTDFYGNPIYGAEDIGPIEYQPPFTIGTSFVDVTGDIRIYRNGKYRYTSATSSTMSLDMSILPVEGAWSGNYGYFMDVYDITWTAESKTFTASSSVATTTTITIGGLDRNRNYTVTNNSSIILTMPTNGLGELTFNLSTWSVPNVLSFTAGQYTRRITRPTNGSTIKILRSATRTINAP